MKNTVLTYIDGFRHNRHERLVLASVLLVLALIVSLMVYWQLRLHGIAMTNETFCGYEEHTHTEECYEYTLICGLEETEGHTHDVSCYDEEGNLVCGLEESEGHTHIDECYEETLVCELPEHVHTVECLIDLNADVEDYEIWEATLPELTGDLRTDVVSIAYSQLDYTESTANYSIGEDGETHYGYTRYGAWYGNEYGTWDSMFAAFCLHYAGIDESVFPVNSGAYAWAVQLQEAGVYSDAADYTASAGDIVFFDTDYDGRVDRTGVVASTDTNAGVVTIIEGDYTVSEVDTVCEHIYALSDPTIVGYGVLPVTEEAEVEETDAEDTDTEETESEETEETEEDSEETEDETLWIEESLESLYFSASDGGVSVTVIAPEGALPDNATLAVTLLDEDSDEYATAAEAVGYDSESEETGMAALDITFYDEYGTEVEPTAAVTVSVDITEIIPEGTTADTIEVTHITDTDVSTVETLVETVTDDTDESAVVVFATESFSTFTIQWGSNGYGSSSVSISATTYVYGTSTQVSANIRGVTANFGSAVNLTSSNNNLSINGYTLTTASVTYNGTTYEDVASITVSRKETSSGYWGSTSYTYTVTITYTNGTSVKIASDVSSVSGLSISLYYTASSGGGGSGQELDQSKYKSTSVVLYDTFTATESNGTITGGSVNTSARSYVSSIQLNGVDVIYADSSKNSTWSSAGGKTLSNYYPNANTSTEETVTLTITPATGYYVYAVVIGCTGGGSSEQPYNCNTWAEGNAFQDTFDLDASGTVSVEVSSKYFAHASSANYYFILVDIRPVPSPLYVEYDYGEIVDILGEGSASSAFSTASGWTTANSNNYYGNGYYDTNGDKDEGVKTANTQYKYAYASADDASEASNWTHNANTITENAKAQALAAGYVFAGWKAEYYTSVSVYTNSDQDDDGYQDDYNNWDYTWDTTTAYGTATYAEGASVTLTTNVRLIAQWVPIGVTVTKEVTGLTGTEFASTKRTYTLQLQVKGDDNGTETWTNYGNEIELTVTGDGTASTTFYPLPEGTYRVIETSGNSNLTTQNGSTIYYVTVSADGTVTVSDTTYSSYTSSTTVNSTTVLLAGELTVTNSYSDVLQTVDITLTKIDTSGNTLSGAEFTLTDSSGNTTSYTVGSATMEDLTVGSSYTLTETTAPNGYALLSSSISFTVTSTSEITLNSGSDVATVTVDGTTGEITIAVENTSSPEMPQTGGRGTKLYTMVGILLMCSGGYLLYRKQKRKCKWRWNI